MLRRLKSQRCEQMKPVIAWPYNCMVGCDTCAKLCPRDAIVFPHLAELRKLRDEVKAVQKARAKVEELKRKVLADSK